jgi:hypothetical protein
VLADLKQQVFQLLRTNGDFPAELGADESLTKPVDLKLLFSSLSKLLGIPLEAAHEAA